MARADVVFTRFAYSIRVRLRFDHTDILIFFVDQLQLDPALTLRLLNTYKVGFCPTYASTQQNQ